jgi:hypothetical protein
VARAENDGQVAFLIAGTQRGGTTTLVEYLRQHPQVFLPKAKELHFFDKEKLWQTGVPDYAVYHAAFAEASPGRLLGDATPIYMYWERSLPRIRAYNPRMKFIMVLRNPITRAYSHWNHERHAGREKLPFREALAAEPERTRQAAPQQLRHSSYVDRGMYTRQLARVWEFFPAEQTLILRTDDFSRALAPMFERIAGFLGIARFTPVQEIAAHAHAYEAPLAEEDRRYLADVFEPEIRALERLLGWDCSDWLAARG